MHDIAAYTNYLAVKLHHTMNLSPTDVLKYSKVCIIQVASRY